MQYRTYRDSIEVNILRSRQLVYAHPPSQGFSDTALNEKQKYQFSALSTDLGENLVGA